MRMTPDLKRYLEDRITKGGSAAASALSVLSKYDNESVADVLRHDKGHDDWHAAHGDPPCKDEADCAAMRAKYDDTVGGSES